MTRTRSSTGAIRRPRPRGAALLVLASLLLAPAGGRLAARPERPPKSTQSYGSGKVFKPEFNDLVRHADVIVVGKVVQIGGIPHAGPSKNRASSKKYTYWEDSFAMLEVEETLKGKIKGARVKVAYHSDLEGDKTRYQSGKKYIAFLTRPSKYPDAYTTAHFHFGEYLINERGKAERVADSSEISKPAEVVIENVRKALAPHGKDK